MNTREMLATSTAAWMGLTQVQRELRDILAAMALNDADGYPSSCIGASPETPGPPIIYEGNCGHREHGRALMTVNGIERWVTDTVYCGNLRPCQLHDTPVTLTSTERAGLAQKPNMARREVEISLLKIAAEIRNLQRQTEPYRPRKEEPPRCNAGSGRDGNEQWANPPLPSLTLKCERFADVRYFGLCADCWDSMQKWRKAKGLEPVERAEVDYLTQQNVRTGPGGKFQRVS